MSEEKTISIVNCVSEAHEMLEFSSDHIILNAGIDSFNYIIVKWRTNKDVESVLQKLRSRYLISHPNVNIIEIEYQEDKSVGYVPNLRQMMNVGFARGLELADYVGLTNTDQCFYKDWLINLQKHAEEDIVVTSTLIEGGETRHYFLNLGVPTYPSFNLEVFKNFCARICKDGFIDESQTSFMNLQSLPYLFSRKIWKQCGPWELTLANGTPDVNFFTRVHNAGFKFKKINDSIAYHLGGAERGATKVYKKPTFSETMRYE